MKKGQLDGGGVESVVRHCCRKAHMFKCLAKTVMLQYLPNVPLQEHEIFLNYFLREIDNGDSVYIAPVNLNITAI